MRAGVITVTSNRSLRVLFSSLKVWLIDNWTRYQAVQLLQQDLWFQSQGSQKWPFKWPCYVQGMSGIWFSVWISIVHHTSLAMWPKTGLQRPPILREELC